MPVTELETGLETAAARAAMRAFGLPADSRLDFIKHRENHVYRVRTPELDLALRMHRPGYRTDDDLRTEVQAMAAFGAGGVAVPTPHRSPDGDDLVVVTDEAGTRRQATMLEWCPGAPPIGDSGAVFTGAQRPGRLRELGRLAAQLHDVAARLDPGLGAARPAWDAAGLAGPAALWGDATGSRSLDDAGRATLAAADARLQAELAELPRDAASFGYIHADLTFENVLGADRGLVAIDFDDSGLGWYLFDLATVHHWCTMHPAADELLAELIGGYREIRPITDRDAAAWEHLLMARALAYLGWSAERPGDPVSDFHEEVLVPWVLAAAERYVRTGRTGWPSLTEHVDRAPRAEHTPKQRSTMSLRTRRNETIGQYSPLFYEEPIELVSGQGVWLTAADGTQYLDGYNNVPHVGHAHPRVVEAIREQSARLNIHTRYLNDRVVEYAERLLATFDAGLDRVMFTNSGSESNDLALRIAHQHTGARGILVSDHSYHGHTQALAALTTGLRTHEGLGAHVRPIRVPDLDGADRGRDEAEVLREALDEAAAAIQSLRAAGHGLAALLVDPLFSTEGLNRLPDGYLRELTALVRRSGGLVIGDEVQSGFGRTGAHFWGYQAHGIVPDFVTMGKPMGNGHPLGGVVLPAALLDEFGPRNMYFNTFGGNPVSSAAGLAVLDVLRDEDLVARSLVTGQAVREGMQAIVDEYSCLGPVKGSGLFFGFEVLDRPRDEPGAKADPAATKLLVEGVKRRGVLISRIGRHDSVLKMRPPMPFGLPETRVLLDAVRGALADIH